jgi:hypothetical protein
MASVDLVLDSPFNQQRLWAPRQERTNGPAGGYELLRGGSAEHSEARERSAWVNVPSIGAEAWTQNRQKTLKDSLLQDEVLIWIGV